MGITYSSFLHMFNRIYRATAMLLFISFYPAFSNSLNSFLLITAILSDYLDSYLGGRCNLAMPDEKPLDLRGLS